MSKKNKRLTRRRREACNQGRQENILENERAAIRRAERDRQAQEEERIRQSTRSQSQSRRDSHSLFDLFAGMLGLDVEKLLALVERMAAGFEAQTSSGPRARAAHYEILGADPSNDLETIKGKFKALVKKLHPDACGGDKSQEERLKMIIEAYRAVEAERRPRS
jgi:DnaJ domain